MCMSGSIERRFEAPRIRRRMEENVNRCRLTLRVRVHFFELFENLVLGRQERKREKRRISQGKREEGETGRD